jgi:integral membrane protein
VRNLFTAYRWLALVVGVLLAFCSLVALPLKYLLEEGTSLQELGETASVLWVVHGWVFMVYVVVAFLLSRRAGWSLRFTGLALVAGLVPLLIFWVERQVASRFRQEHPELAASDA